MPATMASVSDRNGLEILFDPAIDRGGWPGVLGDRRAAAGRVWLGPVGLLERLEVELARPIHEPRC